MSELKVEVDKRRRVVRPAPAEEQAAREAFVAIAKAEVAAAKALAAIESFRSYICSGKASVQEWAGAIGFGPQQLRRLLALGRALRLAPELEERVRSGSVAAENAVVVGRVLGEPALDLSRSEREDWVRRAGSVAPKVLRDEAERAVECARQGAPTLPMRFRVTKKTRDGFRRARILMSRGRKRAFSDGEAFGGLVDSWLRAHDPRERMLPVRRRESAPQREGVRYIPRRVRAIVERRSGGLCEVCRERRAREKIHFRVPHAMGGSREADNIADACRDCHVLVDAGVFRFTHVDENGRLRWRFDRERLESFRSKRWFEDGRVRERAPPYSMGPSAIAASGRIGCDDGPRCEKTPIRTIDSSCRCCAYPRRTSRSKKRSGLPNAAWEGSASSGAMRLRCPTC
jgi:hypothetical protein